ncbi:response regulator [Acuticoccus sp.]|uniref:response regulator n=1 Tax=Acuticoccus sp. TaxID=1904378 RepID=UPI003B51771B
MRPDEGEILIVEDETLIGFDLADLLADAGYKVNGPYTSVPEALSATERSAVRLAILDVNLGDGTTSEAIARRMTERGTPILFVSGYTSAGSEVLRNFPEARQVSKPWDPPELLRTVAQFIGGKSRLAVAAR